MLLRKTTVQNEKEDNFLKQLNIKIPNHDKITKQK